MKLIKKELILLLILSLGIFLRIYYIASESIWLDEGLSIYFANHDIFGILQESARDTHPPLYIIILHYWIYLFGASEVATRLLSAILGSLSILLIYRIGSLLFDKNVGLLASLLLAVSVFHVHYSQEIRSYTLFVLLILLSFYFFIKLLRNTSHLLSIGYIVSTTLLMYTHVCGLFSLAAQHAYFFSRLLLSDTTSKPSLKNWVWLQTLVVILYSPWISIIVYQRSNIESLMSWTKQPSMATIKRSLIEYAGSPELLLLFLALSSLSIFAIIKTSGAIHRKDFFESLETYRWSIAPSNVDRIYLLMVWFFCPIIIPFIISQFATPIYLTRVTIPASLALYLLTARGLSTVTSNYVRLGTVVIIIALSLTNLRGYYANVDKEQWRDVAYFVDSNAKPGDLVLFNSGTCLKTVFNYYSKRGYLVKKPFPAKTKYVDEENIQELEHAIEGHDRIWLVLSHTGDEKGLIKKALSESFKLSYWKKYLGINLHLFVKNDTQTLPKSQIGSAVSLLLRYTSFSEKPKDA